VPTNRSAIAFAFGARIGVRMISMPSAKHLVEGIGELAVAIVNQEAQRALALPKRPGEVSRLLRDPGAVRSLAAAGEVDAAAPKLDEEEHVDPPQCDGLDAADGSRRRGRLDPRAEAGDARLGGAGSRARGEAPRSRAP